MWFFAAPTVCWEVQLLQVIFGCVARGGLSASALFDTCFSLRKERCGGLRFPVFLKSVRFQKNLFTYIYIYTFFLGNFSYILICYIFGKRKIFVKQKQKLIMCHTRTSHSVGGEAKKDKSVWQRLGGGVDQKQMFFWSTPLQICWKRLGGRIGRMVDPLQIGILWQRLGAGVDQQKNILFGSKPPFRSRDQERLKRVGGRIERMVDPPPPD